MLFYAINPDINIEHIDLKMELDVFEKKTWHYRNQKWIVTIYRGSILAVLLIGHTKLREKIESLENLAQRKCDAVEVLEKHIEDLEEKTKELTNAYNDRGSEIADLNNQIAELKSELENNDIFMDNIKKEKEIVELKRDYERVCKCNKERFDEIAELKKQYKERSYDALKLGKHNIKLLFDIAKLKKKIEEMGDWIKGYGDTESRNSDFDNGWNEAISCVKEKIKELFEKWQNEGQ